MSNDDNGSEPAAWAMGVSGQPLTPKEADILRSAYADVPEDPDLEPLMRVRGVLNLLEDLERGLTEAMIHREAMGMSPSDVQNVNDEIEEHFADVRQQLETVEDEGLNTGDER